MLNIFRFSKSYKRKNAFNETSKGDQHEVNLNDTEHKPYHPLNEDDSVSAVTLVNNEKKHLGDDLKPTPTELLYDEIVATATNPETKLSPAPVEGYKKKHLGDDLKPTPTELLYDEIVATATNPETQVSPTPVEGYNDFAEERKPKLEKRPFKKKTLLQKAGFCKRNSDRNCKTEIPSNSLNLSRMSLNDTKSTQLNIVQPCGTDELYANMESQYITENAIDTDHILESSMELNSVDQIEDIAFDLPGDSKRSFTKQSCTDDDILKMDVADIGYGNLHEGTVAETSYHEKENSLLKSANTLTLMPGVDVVKQEDSRIDLDENDAKKIEKSSNMILYKSETFHQDLKGKIQIKKNLVMQQNKLKAQFNFLMKVMDDAANNDKLEIDTIQADSSVVQDNNVQTLKHNTLTLMPDVDVVKQEDSRIDLDEYDDKKIERSSNTILYKSETFHQDLKGEIHSQKKKNLVMQQNKFKEQFNFLMKVMDHTANKYKLEIDTIQADSSVVQDNNVQTLKHNEELIAKIQAAELKCSELISVLELILKDNDVENLDLIEAKTDWRTKFEALDMHAKKLELLKEDYINRLKLQGSKSDKDVERHEKKFMKTEEIEEIRANYESQIKKLKTEINNYERAEQETHRTLKDQMTNHKEELKQCIEKAKEDAARFWEQKHNKEMDALRNELDEVHKKTVDALNAKIKDNNVSRAQQIEAFQAERLKNESLQKQQIEQLEENRVQQAKLHLEMKKKYEQEKTELQMSLKSAEKRFHEYLHQEAVRCNALKKRLIEEHRNEMEVQDLQHKKEIAKQKKSMETDVEQLKLKYSQAFKNLKLDIVASGKHAAAEMEMHLMNKLQVKEDEIAGLKRSLTKDQEQLTFLQDKVHVLENQLVLLAEKLSDLLQNSH